MQNKLRLVELFSGIGCQRRGIESSNFFDIESVAVSDIDKEAMLGYAAIHCGLTPELICSYGKYPSRTEMVSELKSRNIGYDFVKKKAYDWDKVERRSDKTLLQKYWLAMKLSNNLGDIQKISELPVCDMLTFSFPCTDCSTSGRRAGMSYEDWKAGTGTRSGLVWEVVRLLKVYKDNNTLPKYLLLENVAALVSKRYICDFEYLNRLISEIGYNVYWKVINAVDCGIPQNRKRVYGVYIRKDIDTGDFEFPVSVPLPENSLNAVFSDIVSDSYNVSDIYIERFSDLLKNCEFPRGSKYRIVAPNNFGHKAGDGLVTRKHVLKDIVPALQAQTGSTQASYVYCKEGLVLRKFTPEECFILMGLSKSDVGSLRMVGISDCSLYRLIGNGLVVNCVSMLMQGLSLRNLI